MSDTKKFEKHIGSNFYTTNITNYDIYTGGSLTLYGEIVNKSNTNYQYVYFKISIYDSDNILIGTTNAIIMNFMANQVRTYESPTFVDENLIKNIGGINIVYEMSDINLSQNVGVVFTIFAIVGVIIFSYIMFEMGI